MDDDLVQERPAPQASRDADDVEGCVFCDIAHGRAPAYRVYEDETTLCILDIHPYSRGHCLVIPKRHVRWWHDMTEEETDSVFRTARQCARRMVKALGCDFVFLYARGRRIPHTHIFLIPTFPDDVLDRLFKALEKFQESPADLARLAQDHEMASIARLLTDTPDTSD